MSRVWFELYRVLSELDSESSYSSNNIELVRKRVRVVLSRIISQIDRVLDN